ncbi:DUF6311 domain-containing protein [Kineothrix sp. MB12-C1]|uniref:DUF6311 domain-containing protein n=1 Tax=Kineothrix sp. MB12-C1 TaxID=3070215 RepID=UPI0027D26862|nr:DUF6311 domain-containing protein [Kineothrix sp. MB12-C1]WMC91734.1 DUF6311 domain-containing protein [Kineothrix sp. MB12-C1]
MKEKIDGIKKSILTYKTIWICALSGALIFLWIYGVHILNPTYTDWLLTSEDGDLTQHYLGWKFFRHAPWRFPLGLIDTIAYPNATSIIFTDSIPLFALFFKVLRFLLPTEFQYFGWFGLLCFMLQGGFGALLVKKYVKSDLLTFIGGIFFVLSPVFIDRMYWMTSLAAHFLCLMALLFLVYYEEVFRKTKYAVIGWGILGALCGSIHIYFLPMCGVVLLGFLLVDAVKGEKGMKVFLPLLSFVGAAATAIFLLGGFGSGMKAGNDGVGYYSFNLNGFYNPHGWSDYIKDMPYTDSQYEGFGYLGLGVLLLLIVAVPAWLGNIRWSKLSLPEWGRKHIKEISYVFIIVVTLIISASNIVMYSDKVLCEVPLPGMIYRLWSVFRATGRLIWPMVYLLVLGAICMDAEVIGRRVKGMLLAFCLLLQFTDIKGALVQKNQIYDRKENYQTLLPSEEWGRIARETQVRHICFVSDMVSNRKLLFSFGDYASDYGLTLSNFYFARSLGDKEIVARDRALEALSPDTAFVFFKNESQKCLDYSMNYYEIDGLLVGCSAPFSDLNPLTEEELTTYRYDLAAGQFMNNGEIVDGKWQIHPYGNTYGPYLSAQPGRYKVTVTGSGFSAVDIKCYYHGGDVNLEPLNAVIEESRVVYEVELAEYASGLEFALWNIGGGDMIISDIIIEKQ